MRPTPRKLAVTGEPHAVSRGSRGGAPIHGPWWISPAGAVALVVPGTLWLAANLTESEFRALSRTDKSLTTDSVQLMLLGALALVVGALAAQLALESGGTQRHEVDHWSRGDARTLRRLRAASTVLFRATVFGYAAFLVVAVARGLRFADVAQAASGNTATNTLRELFAPVTGVTTLTQVGIAVVVVNVYLLVLAGPDHTAIRRLATVVALGLVRAYLVNERLAFIELAVPAVAVLAGAAVRRGPATRWAFRLAPLVLVPLLVLTFSLFEYSRSYTFYGSRTGQSFLAFGLDRLGGYYATSYNNGHLLLTHLGTGGRTPFPSVEVIWTAPGVPPPEAFGVLPEQDYLTQLQYVLTHYGSPEFNSPGGLAVPFVDFGPVGGLVFFATMGAIMGATYLAYGRGNLYALLAYPTLVTGFFELPRYLYWSQGRLAVPVVALVAAAGYALARPRATQDLVART